MVLSVALFEMTWGRRTEKMRFMFGRVIVSQRGRLKARYVNNGIVMELECFRGNT